jgi:hypothetical protein
LGEGGAPAVLPDGQMIYFDRNFDLAEGQFYTVQVMVGLPNLPAGKIAIGQGYDLFATGFPVGANPLTGCATPALTFRHDYLIAKSRCQPPDRLRYPGPDLPPRLSDR